MMMSIVEDVKKCNRCALRKTLPANNKTSMGHLRIPKHPFDIVSMEHVSIDNRATGTQKILTVVDHFTKYAFLIHVNNERATTTAKKLMEDIFLQFSFPKSIHNDNGSAFVNYVMKELSEMCGMNHTKSLPYTPQGNAICERINQALLDMLGTLGEEKKKNLKNHLATVQYAYNTTVHALTGYEPFFSLFGRHPRLVGDIILDINHDQVYRSEYISVVRKSLQTAYKKCKESILKNNERHKNYYDSKLPVIRELELGDIVVTRKIIHTSKIDDRWNGERYEVIYIPVDDKPVYTVKSCETGKVVSKHRNSLLSLFRQMIKPTKVNPPKKDRNLSTTDTSDDETEDDNVMGYIIVEIPGNLHGHEDYVEKEDSGDEIAEKDVGRASDSCSDDTHTPPKRIRRPPDRYTPANYNTIFVTTR